MKTHFDPFHNPKDNEEYTEKGYCGTYINEEYGNITNKISDVDCKKCLKLKNNAIEEKNIAMEHSISDMGGFVEFMKEERFFCCDNYYSFDTANFNDNYESKYECPKCTKELNEI